MQKLDGKFYGVIHKAKNDAVVPVTEWVVFLAHDDAFFDVLPLYRERCIQLGADAEQVAAVDRLMKRVLEWRTLNPDRCKVPGAKGERMTG